MSTYAIGDVQGCYQELLALLDQINFDKRNDRLWFTGDLVNRGPESTEMLRYAKQLDAVTVLGNHDLHLLAVAAGKTKPKKRDTLDAILDATDKDELLEWLRHRPLLYIDDELGYTLIHAGLPPQWDLEAARSHAKEVEDVLQDEQARLFFANMYGDEPRQWSATLQEWERLRFITNCFTRMRYCDANGRLALQEKGPPGTQSAPYIPWFRVPGRKSLDQKIIFGHWATLRLGNERNFENVNVYPLDDGCVWGGALMALRLEDGSYFSVPSRQKKFKFKDVSG
ncbi:MAG: symmetrical bis(5'-nucleosyl)-tetraphosphatase [Gammaproteobacteria bacterium]